MPVPARSPWRIWSKEEIAAAIDMRSKGKRNAEIAFQLTEKFKTDRTIGAVEHQFSKLRGADAPRLVRNRHGILVPSPWPQRDEELRALWLQDSPRLTTEEIASKMGLSKNSVIPRAGRIGLPQRGSPIIRDGREHKRKRRPPQIKSTLPALSIETVAIKNVFHPRFVVETPSLPSAPNPEPMTRTCQWIHGTPGGGREYRFCGRACRGSWCAEHYAVVFLKTPAARSA